jgi:hypothetical protein
MGDQLAQQPAVLRPAVNRADLGFVQADRDELDQRTAFADHAQRAVAGSYQADRPLDDPPQHHLEVKVGTNRDDRLQQRVRPVPGVQDVLQADLQLGQQLIQAQLRHQRVRLRVVHRQPLETGMPTRRGCDPG